MLDEYQQSEHISFFIFYIIIIIIIFNAYWSAFHFILDVDGIKYVINFDYPNSSEDYIHRIGRTGRSQETGTSYAFFTPDNSKQAGDLISVLKEANQEVNPKLTELAMCGGGFGKKSK